MYRDFEDLRDNCPARIRAEIAIDVLHADQGFLNELWPATADGEFRLSLTQTVADYWENAVRGTGSVGDDEFAIEIVVDSYADPEMGHTLLLELHAYCGTEAIGDLTWSIFDDARIETRFCLDKPDEILKILGRHTDTTGIRCEVEVTEVAEV